MLTDYEQYQQRLLITTIKWVNVIFILGILVNSLRFLWDFWGTLIQNGSGILMILTGWRCLKLARQGQTRWAARVYLASAISLMAVIIAVLGQTFFALNVAIVLSLIVLIATFFESPDLSLWWGIVSVLFYVIALTMRILLPFGDFTFTIADIAGVYGFPVLFLMAFALIGRNAARHFKAVLTKSETTRHALERSNQILQEAQIALKTTNDRLHFELTRRERMEEALREKEEKHLEHLEILVKERTAELEHEIEERKRMEEALREERDKAQKYLDIASVIFVVINAEQTVGLINRRGCEVLEYKEEEIIGKNWFDNFLPEMDRDRVKAAFAMLMSGEIEPVEYFENSILTKNGEERIIAWHNAVLRNEEGKIAGTLSSGADITESKQAEEERVKLEEQLRQSQKMEAIGTLAGGIAHDFNNILGTMLGYTELLLTKQPENSKEKTYLERVYQAGERARSLVQQILAFSRADEQHLIPRDVAPIIEEALKMLRATIPAHIDIRQHIRPDCRPILADAVQIEQVIVNLCVNASHAMKEKGGTLEISLEEVNYDTDQGDIPDLPAGWYLKLTVRDTGCGMRSEVQEHIFEPFFTTKGVGEGAGLGLSVVHGIIKSHRGVITVESQPGQGSTFRIFFPVTHETVPQKKQAKHETAVRRGKGHILIIDDETDLVNLYEIALTKLGYHVTTFHTGDEALELFRANPEQFDLIFTDQTMPGMTGVQLCQELLSLRPDLPVILATGYSDLISEKEARALGIRHFIIKPVRLSTLIQIIQKYQK